MRTTRPSNYCGGTTESLKAREVLSDLGEAGAIELRMLRQAAHNSYVFDEQSSVKIRVLYRQNLYVPVGNGYLQSVMRHGNFICTNAMIHQCNDSSIAQSRSTS